MSTLKIGNIYTIIRTDFDIDAVKIELSRDGGLNWELIAASVSIPSEQVGDQQVYSNLSYPWTVTGPETAHGLFRITGLGEDSDIVSISSRSFSINNDIIPPLELDVALNFSGGEITFTLNLAP